MGKDREKLREALRQAARRGRDPAGHEYRYLTVGDTVELSRRLGVSRRRVELAALTEEIVPERYQRNIGTVGLPGQVKLLQSRIGVVGAGGLGGFAVELLARMGVGTLVVIDGDSFSDSNLNRQLAATERTLGEAKVEAAARRAREVNGAVTVEAFARQGDAQSLPLLLEGCHLALDCLDNLSARFALEEACGRLNIPLVHGAIAGFMAQLAVIRPGRPLLHAIYGDGAASPQGGDRGVETVLGNPAFTPALLAAWQVNEAIKIICGLGGVLYDRLLLVDLQSNETTNIKLFPD